MTPQEVTCISAVIAAFVSICTLCFNIFFQYRAEMRAAYRKTLEPHLATLGQNLYETMACSKVLADKSGNAGKSRDNWRARADKASAELRKLRLAVRYSLWGLDEPLRVITRVPNWITHNKGDDLQTKKLIHAATTLRESIDNSVRRAFTKGRPIPYWERHSLAKRAKVVRDLYQNGAPEEINDNEGHV